MQVEIILSYNDEDFSLQLNEGLELNLTYQAGDIRNVLARNSSLSKTFNIPGTAANNLAFKNIYDVRNYSEFNPNRKAGLKIFNRGSLIFTGYLKLDNIKNNDGAIEYECTTYSDVSNLLTDIEEKLLGDLDFSRFTHDYSYHNVSGSWETFIKIYGQDVPFEYGQGYIYPWADFGINQINRNGFKTDFFRPALFAKTVWDEIFSEAGYSYESDFINSDYFKYLICTQPGKGTHINESLLNDSKAKATVIPNTTQPGANCVYLPTQYENHPNLQVNQTCSSPKSMAKCQLNNDYSTGMYDIGLHFDAPNSQYIVSKNGKYKLSVETFTDLTVHFDYLTPGQSVTPGIVADGTSYYYTQICVLRNGIELQPADLSTSTQVEVEQHHSGHDNVFMNDSRTHLTLTDKEFNLMAGDIVYVKTGFSLQSGFILRRATTTPYILHFAPDVFTFLYECEPTNFAIELVDAPLTEGDTQDFTNFYADFKQKDFILSIAKTFNLYFYIDPNNPRLLHIEPRLTFYNNNIVIDWDYKKAKELEIQLTPTTDLQDFNLLFTYQSDKDYWNDKYTNDSKLEIYGQYNYVNDSNDFIDKKSNDKIDLIFSPGVLATRTIPFSNATFSIGSSSFPETQIYDYDPDKGKSFSKDSNIRLLFYKGLIPAGVDIKIFENYFDYNNIGTQHSISGIPWAGMIDNPYNPVDSLEFGYERVYYYDKTSLTTTTLFNRFWEKFLLDSFDQSSKVMTAFFYLTDADIYNLNFRNIIYLDSRYWIINKIIDYNPLSNLPTKVELLLLINYDNTVANIDAYQQTIVPTSGTMKLDGQRAGKNDETDNFLSYNSYKGLGNSVNQFSNSTFVLGNENSVGQTESVFVLGNQNMINGGSNNSMFIGKNIYSTEYTTNMLFVGQAISGQTFINNAVNTNHLNLIPDLSGNPGTILINGVPISNTTITAETVGATSYVFSGLNQLDGISSFVSMVEAEVVGYNYTNYKAYTGKVVGGFKISGQTLVQIINEPDLFEKSDFGTNVQASLFTNGVGVYISVIGEAGETINWKANYKETII